MLTVTPAYGSDYKSKKEVIAAWEAGKDFIIRNAFSPDDGRYINKQDADKARIDVMVRYKREAQICIIKAAKVKA